MSEKRLTQNFTSYINGPPLPSKNGSVCEMKPKLLNGELVTGPAHNVEMLTPLSKRDKSRLGSLFVTNYKLSFVPFERFQTFAQAYCQHNFLLGTYDVPLTCVAAVWLTDGGPVRRRRLMPYGDMPAKVKGLQVVCKNMKVLTFSFVNHPVDQGRKIALALMHHAFPKRHDLLFAFECKEVYHMHLPPDMNMFQRPGDWKRELERCESPHWRITCINGTSDAFMLTAGETLIVPSSVLDYNLMEAARHFRAGRVPVWAWGRARGAALLRSAELLPTEHAAAAESVLLEQIRRSHPKLTPPHVLYLCGNSFVNSNTNSANVLPPLPALQTSYKRLAELCTPTTLRGFWMQDSQYYSILDSSRWLRYVASCIAFADEAARQLADNVTVVLQEGDGVDYSAVVSSLTQILVDPYFRTISGFQSLVQKEWVAMGHPFCDRFGLPRPGNPKDVSAKDATAAQAAPVFLLFLDCVWQLSRQFPAALQLTETYLTTLWDTAHNHLFDTFLFNCARDRELAVQKNFVQRPVWDWGEQFSDEDRALFYNPLYPATKSPTTPKQRLSQSSTQQTAELDRLTPCTSVAGMELWSQCYERWLLPLDAPHTGTVQHHVFHLALRESIQKYQKKLASLSALSRHANGIEVTEQPRVAVSRFHPFSLYSGDDAPNLDSMDISLIDASLLLDSVSLLNSPD